MNRSSGSRRGLGHMAFWGSSNAAGADAAIGIARQLRVCEMALAGRAEIDHFFYTTREPVEAPMELAVRRASGPGRCDRDWDALMRILGVGDCAFTAVTCANLGRLGRGAKLLKRMEEIARGGADLVCFTVGLDPFATASLPATNLMIRRIVAAFREADGASVEAVTSNCWEQSRG